MENMEDFWDTNPTTKRIKLESDNYLKRSKKLNQIYETRFSQEEKVRAETCKEGTATKLLDSYVYKYVTKILSFYGKEVALKNLKINLPSVDALVSTTFESSHRNKLSVFNRSEPYFNKYFAHWYIKSHWEVLIEKAIHLYPFHKMLYEDKCEIKKCSNCPLRPEDMSEFEWHLKNDCDIDYNNNCLTPLMKAKLEERCK